MKLKLVKLGTDTKRETPMCLCTADVRTPPKSKGPVLVPGTMKPIDIESLPLEEQAIAQVLADEVEKAENAGIENPTINLTRAKVKAKLKKLKKNIREQKRMKTMN
jgi:hypothetical protein